MSKIWKRVTIVLGNLILPVVLLSGLLTAGAGDVQVFAEPPSVSDAVGGEEDEWNADKIVETIETIASWFVWIMAAISVLFIIYGGFVWMTGMGASGDDGPTKGKKIIINALVGLVIALVAFIIVRVVVSVVDTVKDDSGASNDPGTTGFIL